MFRWMIKNLFKPRDANSFIIFGAGYLRIERIERRKCSSLWSFLKGEYLCVWTDKDNWHYKRHCDKKYAVARILSAVQSEVSL